MSQEEMTWLVVSAIQSLQDIIGLDNRSKGFWDDPVAEMMSASLEEAPEEVFDFHYTNRKIALMGLIVTEVAEGMEGVRKGLSSDHLEGRTMEEEEMADVVIRVLDYCARFDIDLATVIVEKLVYNRQRDFMHGDNKI